MPRCGNMYYFADDVKCRRSEFLRNCSIYCLILTIIIHSVFTSLILYVFSHLMEWVGYISLYKDTEPFLSCLFLERTWSVLLESLGREVRDVSSWAEAGHGRREEGAIFLAYWHAREKGNAWSYLALNILLKAPNLFITWINIRFSFCAWSFYML